MYGIAMGIQRDPKHHQYAIADRMTEWTMDLVKSLCSPDMSAEDGAALLWYARNLLYFDLGLQQDRRVLLVKYEDLVTNPGQYVSRVFQFIGCRFDQNYIRDIFTTSVKKHAAPSIKRKIEVLCREMSQRLDQRYALQLLQPPRPIFPTEAQRSIRSLFYQACKRRAS
jgi:hypothetical protein